MAEPCTCRCPGHNPLLDGQDELIKDLLEAFTKDSNTFTLSPAISWAQTLAPAPAPASALTPALSSIKNLCQ